MSESLEIVRQLLPGVASTLSITVAALAIGSVVGIPIVVMARSQLWPLRVLANAYVDVVRGVPVLVWLLLIFYGLPASLNIQPFQAACLGIGGLASAYMAENYRGALASVPATQAEAGYALGLTRLDVAMRVVIPQALVAAIPPSATFAISLIKESAVASIIGAEEIVYFAMGEINSGGPSLLILALAGAMYILLGLPLAWFSRWIDARLSVVRTA